MAFSCNIDRKGRIARGITGFLVLIAGGVVVVRSWIGGGGVIGFAGGGILSVLGLFMLFEAWKGWCVARAMGMKTPM